MATWRLPPIPPKLAVQPPKVDFQSGGEGSDVYMAASGLESLAETLKSVPQVFRDAAGYEMAEIAHEVIDLAKAEFVPFASGALRDSGNADEYDPGTTATILDIAMWFGAPGWYESSPYAHTTLEGTILRRYSTNEGLSVKDPSLYALEQHENLSYHHRPPPDQTGPKYLERPFNIKAPDMLGRIAAKASVALGTNGAD